MKKLPDDVPDCIVFLLAKAYQKAHGDCKKQLQPYGLTNLQHLVLEGLWQHQGMTAAQLGKFLILDKATLSGVLERMAARGWISKKPHPEDGRLQCLFTSSQADELQEKLTKKRRQTNEQIMSPFSIEEKLLFKRFLADVVEGQ